MSKGRVAEYNEVMLYGTKEEVKQYNFDKEKNVGDYKSYSDKWILQNVEHGTGEGVRTSHDEKTLFIVKDPFLTEEREIEHETGGGN